MSAVYAYDQYKRRETFTPSNMRKGVKRGGVKEQGKQKAFADRKRVADKYIHQAYSVLEKLPMYRVWCSSMDNLNKNSRA